MDKEEQGQATHYSVYVAQNGSSMQVILSKDENRKLYEALFDHGVPCCVWQAVGYSSTGIFLAPRRGGLTYNAQVAQPWPADANGNLLTSDDLARGAQPAATVAPKDLPQARVVVPPWSESESDVAHFVSRIPRLEASLSAIAGGLAAFAGARPPAPPPAPGGETPPPLPKRAEDPPPSPLGNNGSGHAPA